MSGAQVARAILDRNGLHEVLSRSRRAAPFPITTTRARRHCSCPSRSTGRAPSPRPRSPLTRRATRFRMPAATCRSGCARRCSPSLRSPRARGSGFDHRSAAQCAQPDRPRAHHLRRRSGLPHRDAAGRVQRLQPCCRATARARSRRPRRRTGRREERAQRCGLTYVAGALAALTSSCTTRSSSSATATEAERGLRWSPPRPTRSHTPSRRRSSPARSSRDRSSARSPSPSSTTSREPRFVRPCDGWRPSVSCSSSRIVACVSARCRARSCARPFSRVRSWSRSRLRLPSRTSTGGARRAGGGGGAFQPAHRDAARTRARRAPARGWSASGCGRTTPSTTSSMRGRALPTSCGWRRARGEPLRPDRLDGRLGARRALREERPPALRDPGAIAAESIEGARELAREHVLASGNLLEVILDQVERPSRSTAA